MEVQFQIAHLGTVQQMVVQHNKMSRGHFKLTLPIDTLVFAKPEEPLGKLQDQFVESVTTQVSAMSDCIQRYTKGKTVPQPQAFHFELPEKMSLTTVIFPAGVSDEALELQRKELHAKFGLENKPFFRRQMTFDFPDDEAKSTYYKDVHKYIPAPDPNEFKVSLIHGSYTFHHCLQDDENDREWGAPYHCLQVVISWYYLQGYIDTPVPLISEMQEILIKIDEDYTRVVNENAWLKSDEMLAILKYFNISCKTTDIRISAEKEIDLTPHFNEEGTPIVIWKSPVFSEPKAFILLGMAINEDSDTSKVLVLDTMYTRLNDFNWIIDKAIEWKGHEFWEEMEIFALIMPLRPRGI
ncbi:ufm1-specific protease 2-like [Chiloscyllium plagiosum]|uniref:ufm1-specific protease 2-like n=1 Tax=Chiloscyllium plagiosum TaxID=36176 RepID=UPI001CB7FCAE|nr:ufm1-specific protease 2-like [Chiloscyllium plagiosum]